MFQVGTLRQTQIALISQSSLGSQNVSSDWKIANAALLFVTSVRKKAGFYRAVGLTMNLGKMLEAFIEEIIEKH